MANKELERPDVTFYLYSRDSGNLHKNETLISSPYNFKTQGTESEKFEYREPQIARFNNGLYTLKENEVGGPDEYDKMKDFLSKHNPEGGLLLYPPRKGKFHSNIKSRHLIVKLEKPIVKEEVKTVIVKEEVEIQKIPRSVAQMMDFTQLDKLARGWKIEIPEEISNSKGTSKQITDKYIELLKEHLTDN